MLILHGGGKVKGYFVSEDDAAVYLGEHGAITAYPHDAIREVSVFPAPHRKYFSIDITDSVLGHLLNELF